MPLSAKQKIRVGFGLLLILPTVLFLLAARQISKLIRANEAITFTETVLRDMNETLSLLKDVEVDQREYMLTGDAKFLAEYEKSKGAVDDQITKIEKETFPSKRLQDSIETLRLVTSERFQEIDRSNVARQSGGLEAATGLNNDYGKQPMDNIRQTIARMVESERLILEKDEKQQRDSFAWTLAVFALVLALNFALVFSVRYFMNREVQEHAREEQRFRELNIELERRVQERTEELQRSNEDLQQFAYMVSHDLKEPLRMVASYTELLHRKYRGKLDESADEFIGFVLQGVRRMTALIEAMLTYARAADTAASTSAANTRDALNAALENLRVRIDETRAEVTSDELPAVEFDPVRLTQIFQNLIGNALKYKSDAPPRIHVGAAARRGEIVFSVRDNGIGIDPIHKEKVFGAFQRLHGREYEGTGIGLATCKKIVERRGGRIWFESEPGKGSTFYFTVPVSMEEKKSAPDKRLVARG